MRLPARFECGVRRIWYAVDLESRYEEVIYFAVARRQLLSVGRDEKTWWSVRKMLGVQ